MVKSPNPLRKILVCQNRTCHKQGAAAVLKAFQSPLAKDVAVIGSGCLGECGNGPIVLVGCQASFDELNRSGYSN